MNSIARRTVRVLLIGAFSLAGMTQAAAANDQLAATEPRAVTSAIAFGNTWARSLDLVHEGQFDQASTLLNEIVGDGPASAQASAWLDTWMDAERSRLAKTQKDYEKYCNWSQEQIAKDDIREALDWAYRAKLNAPDQKAFLAADWLADLRTKAMANGTKLREGHEWRDAHNIFYWLSLLFEDDDVIDQQRKECFEHARLESIYTDDYDWRDGLEGIDASMVEEALYRIDEKYVEEPDFRALTLAGFRELLLLCESPAVQSQFEALAGERGRDFKARIDRKLRQATAEKEMTRRDAIQYFSRAMEINKETAQLPEALMVKEYMSAALGELDDFTSMIWPVDYREFEKHTRGDFVGVGIQIRNRYNPDIKDNEILVVTPLEDTPAYRAGIQANDVITHVNGQTLAGVVVSKAVTMITGPLGTTVNLTIRRTNDDGEEVSIDFKLKRDIVKIKSIKGLTRSETDEQNWEFIIDHDLGIAYIRMSSFQENTADDLRAALSEAEAEGMRGLILDLRFNPGGLLKSAVEVAEMFLDEGDRIVSTKGRRSAEWWVDAEHRGRFKDVPLILLVNDGSASASEIVSGAIKDHHRGVIIGERTFGKFSVQNLLQLVHSEAHLKLTTAKYYLPSGQNLHHDKGATIWGVSPDISVPLVPKEVQKIYNMQRDMDVIGAVKTSSEDEFKEPVKPIEDSEEGDTVEPTADGGGAEVAAEPEEEYKDENTRPQRDPQYETALLAMRLHLVHDRLNQVAGVTKSGDKEVTHE